MKPEIKSHCYCNIEVKESSMIPCNKCRRHFHTACFRSGKPSPLEGDVFFQLTCDNCSNDGEKVSRHQMAWLQVVILTLFNLARSSSGKNGFFRWKEHICSFIDKNWNIFFGNSRKKTNTWHGTVAGTLSQGCPDYFTSGTSTLRESGWWKLANNRPPSIESLAQMKSNKKGRSEKDTVHGKVGGLRSRHNKTSIQAAIELRAKRDTLHESKESQAARLRRTSGSKETSVDPVVLPLTKQSLEAFSINNSQGKDNMCSPDTSISESCGTSRIGNYSFELTSELTDQSSQMSLSSTRSDMWFTDRDLLPGRDVPMLLMKEDEDGEEIEIDPCALSPSSTPSLENSISMMDPLPNMEDMLSQIGETSNASGNKDELSFKGMQSKIDFDSRRDVIIKSEVNVENENHEDMDIGSDSGIQLMQDKWIPKTNIIDCVNDIKEESKAETCSSDMDTESQENITDEKKTASKKPLNPVREKWKQQYKTPVEKNPDTSLLPATVYEEKMLLKGLNLHCKRLKSCYAANRLKRKLSMHQKKRDLGNAVFDIDAVMNQITGSKRDLYCIKDPSLQQQVAQNSIPVMHNASTSECILDRYSHKTANVQCQQHVSFRTRLVGMEDDQLQPIRSPYTSRMLKPFIRRDYESCPIKLKLLKEIRSFKNKTLSSEDSENTKDSPIDYCYVRPQHIPSINALCCEFFWPGIDVSECLQYPDFSCVVLYRKLIIAFAFMVPDVKYNEAYISFIFTHPEWRRAGIAKFMLYHLIQTCMGKDVTLHVSASNTAMLMYQQFGFKPEEFILDFYEKYFPAESRDSRHAFFLRLRR